MAASFMLCAWGFSSETSLSMTERATATPARTVEMRKMTCRPFASASLTVAASSGRIDACPGSSNRSSGVMERFVPASEKESTVSSTVPKAVTPNRPPMERKNCMEDVATPSMDLSNAPWTAKVKMGNVIPIPMPTMTRPPMIWMYVLWALMKLRVNMPPSAIAMPPMVSDRYLPVRDIRRPATMLDATMDITMGVRTRPELVADAPSTACRNSGR